MTDIRDIQLFQLQMLKDVAKACDENGIEYMISSGTLLGAVRHQGFIPWDDDIDLYMTVENYKKFNRIGQKILGEKYFLQNYKTDKYYNEMWTQVRANNTTSMPINYKNWNIHWGMCLDIFPIVGISDNPKDKRKQRKALLLNRSLLSDEFMKATNQTIDRRLKLLFLIPRSIRKLICRINEHNYLKNHHHFNLCGNIWYDITVEYPSDLFEPLVKIKFEDDMFWTTAKYSEYLEILYGDYMKLPPAEKQTNHSQQLGTIITDLSKSYKLYQII